MKYERATAGARDGTRAHAIAWAMRTLKGIHVECSRCHTRAASHVASDDELVCKDCVRKPARLTVAAAEARLRASMNR